MITESKKSIISQLQKSILQLQGCNLPKGEIASDMNLGPIETAFPNSVFPKAAIHEFLCVEPESAAASNGFITGLLSALMQNAGVCLWISVSRNLFPPALKSFGIDPDRVIFADLKYEKDLLWAMEEGLKCEGLSAVVAEVRQVSFTQSRRLQLTVEKSKVTGFILRTSIKNLSTTACAARWQIAQLPSKLADDMPGVGFPRWNVELLKVKNGNPGSFKIEWTATHFTPIIEQETEVMLQEPSRKAG